MTTFVAIATIILFVFLLAACSSTPAAEETASSDSESDDPGLEIIGLEESRSLTMKELHALETAEGWGGTISSAGVISPPQGLKGVTITELAELVGGLQPGMGVSVVAKDGYAMRMSFEQIVGKTISPTTLELGMKIQLRITWRRLWASNGTANRSPPVLISERFYGFGLAAAQPVAVILILAALGIFMAVQFLLGRKAKS